MAEDESPDQKPEQKPPPEASPEADPEATPADPVSDALSDAQASVDQLNEQVGGMQMPDFTPDDARIEMLGDVDLDVAIELGRTEMLVEDVLKLGPGAVVELDKLAGDPVDVYVNGRLVARGEVLVLNDNFCIRISEIVANLEEQAEAIEAEQKQEQNA